MFLCKHLTCDRPADVLWHGSWCGRHALERFGRVPAVVFEASRIDRNPTPVRPRAILAATALELEPDWLDRELRQVLEEEGTDDYL